MKLRARPFLIIVALLCLLFLAIWGNLSVSVVVKYIASGCAAGIVITFVVVIYHHTVVKKAPETDTPQLSVDTERLPIVPPPRPTHPPRVAALEIAHESEPEPVLYDYRPKPIPAIGYTVVVGIALVGLLIGSLHAHFVWYIFASCALVGVTFCYWQWLIWRGRRLIITKSTKQLQRVLPWPFDLSTPTMPNRSGAAQDVTQKMSDRLLGTCRLFSNIRASGDEMFHNLKWLPHPEELRHALGIPPLRKNSWWLFSKKDS